MIFIIKMIYKILLLPPGSIIFLMILLSIFLKKKNISYWKVLSILTLLLYLISIPLVGDALIGSLEEKYEPLLNVDGDVIVMLGGGATLNTPNLDGLGHLTGHAANRLLTSAQLFYDVEVPILITGGQVYNHTGNEGEIAKRILNQLGVPEEKLMIENKSVNTSQNAEYSKVILEDKGFKKPILVTSAFHMHRSVLQFKKYGVEVIPYPTDYQTNITNIFSYNDLIPSINSLKNFSLAIKEYLGIMAVKWY